MGEIIIAWNDNNDSCDNSGGEEKRKETKRQDKKIRNRNKTRDVRTREYHCLKINDISKSNSSYLVTVIVTVVVVEIVKMVMVEVVVRERNEESTIDEIKRRDEREHSEEE